MVKKSRPSAGGRTARNPDRNMNERPDVAYYYPVPYWMSRETDWIKSLLLFFDRVAILLPGYMYGLHRTEDPTLAGSLEDMGLLEILEPAEWVDGEVTKQLADIVTGLVDAGAFDGLPGTGFFLELSASRVGYCADIELADSLIGKLRDKGLCEPSRDGASIPLHPTVRTTFLVLLAQLLREAARRRGSILHPATGNSDAIGDFAKVMSMDWVPSSSGVIEFDLEPAGIDLSAVPLDDILHFRKEHGTAHREYMLDLRRFMAEIASAEGAQEREALLRERKREMAERARDLHRSAKRAFGTKLASRSFGLAGCAWSLGGGDPIGFALSAASELVQEIIGNPEIVTSYSYLFDIRENFGRT